MSIVTPLALAHLSADYGAKAATLAKLHGVAAISIPSGFAVSKQLFRQTIERALPTPQWPERLIEGPRSERNEERLAQIRKQLLTAHLPAKAWGELLESYRTLRCDCVAVRSSSTHEDGTDYTGAGIFKSELGITNEAQLELAVRAAFGAMFTVNALEYLARFNPTEPPAIALIVQRVVQADSAGVLFTEDPIRREAGLMRIEASLGLGVSVVDGSVKPDLFLIDRSTAAVVTQVVAEKDSVVRVSPSGGLQTVEISRSSQPALNEGQIAEIVAAGRAVERVLGSRRDIEFSFEGSTLWVLQARPIAAAPEPDDERSKWVWSNVNVGEALPGVATPLTWSIAASFSDLGFRRAFGSLGCVVPEDAQLVGRFHGRIYLNLTHFLSIAAQVPALDAKMLLEFGGGGGFDEVSQQIQKGSWAKFALRAPAVAAKFVIENATLERTLSTFDRDFSAFREQFKNLGWASMTRAALGVEFERLHSLLDRTGALMLTCASGSLSSTVFVRLFLQRTMGADDAQRFSQELMTGNVDIESAQPGIALAHLAIAIENNAEAREILAHRSASELRVDDFAKTSIAPQMSAFFQAYGFRAVREAELSTPRWSEDPSFVFAAIKGQLDGGARRALARIDEQLRVRERAEIEWNKRLNTMLQPLARHALARARKFLRLRERMRARVTEVLGFFRTHALETSRRMRELYPELAPDAGFFLDVEDLREFFRGGALDVAALVSTRRATYLRDASRPEPPHTFVGAPPMTTASLESQPTVDTWTGVGASPGVVAGPVRIVHDPQHGALLQPGEVMVVRVADVGWTPLFLVAAGVITELGGALSHASLVAREYGVPAVVNVVGALEALRDGDYVVIDGERGTVARVPSPAHRAANAEAKDR